MSEILSNISFSLAFNYGTDAVNREMKMEELKRKMAEDDDVEPSMTIAATPGDGTGRSNRRRKRIINYNRANDVAGNRLLQWLMSLSPKP